MTEFKTYDLDEISVPKDHSAWTPGAHRAGVTAVDLRPSRAGYPMLVIEWTCLDEDEEGKVVTDFAALLANDPKTGKPFFPKTIRAYLSAFGMWAAKPADRAKYLAADKQVGTMETLADKLLGATGTLKTKNETQPARERVDEDGIPTGEFWPEREVTRIDSVVVDAPKKKGATRSL